MAAGAVGLVLHQVAVPGHCPILRSPPLIDGVVRPRSPEDPHFHVAVDSRPDPVWSGGPQAQWPGHRYLPALWSP